MATIQIKNVPAATHAVLARRAAAAHQSLRAYLLSRLEAEAGRATNADIFDRLSAMGGGGLSVETAVETLREDRARR